MKRLVFLAVTALASIPLSAQVVTDDFDKFIQEENASFDKFIDDANKEFIEFLRHPWKKAEAKKPVERHTKPEPPKPVIYDEQKHPEDTPPVELTIKDILNQTTIEGQQRPTVEVKNVDQLTFDKPTPKPQPQPKPTPKPTVIVAKQNTPTIIGGNTPKVEPAKPQATPVKPQPVAPKAEPTTPAKPQTTPVKPQPVAPKAEPTTPAKPQATPVKPQPKPKAKPAMQSSLQKEFYPSVAINYCNTKLYIDASMKGVINITSSQECAVADGYEALCRSNYKPLIANCQQAQKDFRLNDWGVFLFVKTAAEALCNDENSCIVMQQFLLNELGYRAKMARRGDRNQLLLFVATDCMVYGHPYFTKEGLNYYNINGTEACTFYMCNQDSKKAKTPVAMRLNNVPALNSGVVSRQRTNKAGNVSVSVNVSKSLMDFYASMPQCDYGVYAKAPVAGSLAQEVLGTLRPLVQGKSEVDAANLLLNFVQTGFKYATDEEQFGFEKPFFVEELFYYPACDCEDRSVLFGWLVRELLGLDVVYLDYPNHIATAVQFKGDVKGDFLTVDGKRYTVCDPTYIGASIGMTMPNLRSAGVSILRY
ncbi:hypothetical protein CIK96_07705 [Prevotella sp. P4-98]|uniref:hypothetical protein n=1 Tax=Prevotella sp. P4-98 TaxID=2024219 RepID=UPI000B9698E8|nr:hypothetical protein [Prevotella sp. P4-98]OYP45810.1 hypothetical protein CIK96_07705 [Prevotella sp. P4-98]